jgi:LuxR family maltose regulon positive regulatory protein
VEQLLATKLFIPPTRPKIVNRPRLIDQLNASAHPGCKLILISAPAGFGKTTLVSEWVQSLSKDVPSTAIAWLSLDEGDNDPARFLAYLITALNRAQGVETSFGKVSLNMLQSPQPPPAEAVLTPLINEITAIPIKIILVLDDYHALESAQVDEILTFFLEYLPTQMHLVIASREDPHLPLSHFRARGQLTELRAADLRFSSPEATEFLNQVMGLDLTGEDISSLESRTEGWIAGLQLAAISMRGHEDASSRIKTFTGSHRFILDYLIEEVINQQSESIYSFMLQTSILDRLTGSLCDALTSQDNSQETLELLERANLFIVPLDGERQWYRYHHLFADLLRQRLNQTQPEKLRILHHRASEWYERNGFVDEGIEHALHAKDFERTAHLIERVADAVWARGGSTNLRRWLEGLPDELVLSKPHLCIFQAWELFANGQQDDAERFLQAAELVHDPCKDHAIETESQNWVQQPGAYRLTVRGRADAIRAWMAAYRTDVPEIIKFSSQALKYLPEQDLNWRSATAITLGDAYCIRGEYNAAHHARLDAIEASKAAGNIYLFMNANIKLAITLKARGELQNAMEICNQQFQLASEKGILKSEMVGWLLAIWSDVLAEQNDLDVALDKAKKGISLTERGGDMVMLGWSYVCLIRVLFSTGDMSSAEAIIKKMERVAQETTVPRFLANLNSAWQARIWLAEGKIEEASKWGLKRKLKPEGEPDYVDGFLYIAFARILITKGKWDKTITFLQRMLEVAEASGNITRMIEILVLLALAFQAGNDTDQAMIIMKRALNLAEPRGFYRIFVDEGQPMARLLYQALNRGIETNYVNRLLQAFPIDEPERVEPPVSQVSESGYIEPLSEREIEVLQLISEGLTNPAIASKLFLSPYTIKTHTRNIYGKLGVNNRTQAVSKARNLGILSNT